MARVIGTNRGEALLGRRGVNNETILGLGGDDFLYGLGGDDLLMGGAGDDRYRFDVGDGIDVITDLEGMSSIYFVSTTRTSFAELTSSNFSISGSDLVISVTVGESSQQVTLTDYYLSPSSFTIFYNTSYRGSLSEVSLDDIPVGRYGSASNPFLATADADTFVGSADLDWVSYEGSTAGVRVSIRTSPADTSRSWATGDRLTDINNVIGSDYSDELIGNSGDNILRGGAGNDIIYGVEGNDRLDGGAGDDYLSGGITGNDRLEGGEGADTYRLLSSSYGTDTIEDRAGDTMTLRFDNARGRASYASADFVEAANNFNRVGDNLVISIDKDSEDGVTDKVTIVDAYDSDPSTGIGNAAFTINIEYGGTYRNGPATEITEGFWHFLA